jgi:hypothetical protein
MNYNISYYISEMQYIYIYIFNYNIVFLNHEIKYYISIIIISLKYVILSKFFQLGCPVYPKITQGNESRRASISPRHALYPLSRDPKQQGGLGGIFIY